MFDQFLDNVSGKQMYLMFSLWIFLVFFIVVSLLLFYMRKQHITYMSDIPLNDSSVTIKTNEP
jgi:hypothetical protein